MERGSDQLFRDSQPDTRLTCKKIGNGGLFRSHINFDRLGIAGGLTDWLRSATNLLYLMCTRTTDWLPFSLVHCGQTTRQR